MMQAEQLINRMEFHRSVYDTDERNLIMNHAYKQSLFSTPNSPSCSCNAALSSTSVSEPSAWSRYTDTSSLNSSNALSFVRGSKFVPIMRSGGINDGYPQFYDFDVDMSAWEVHTVSELPAMIIGMLAFSCSSCNVLKSVISWVSVS